MVRAKLQLNMFKKNRPFKVKQTNITTLENTERLKEKLEDIIENTKDLNTQNKYNKFEELLNTKKRSKPRNEKDTIKWLTNKTKELLKNRVKLISMTKKMKSIRRYSNY